MLHTSYIEISKSALNNNIEQIRKHIGKDVRYSMVIKANAYEVKKDYCDIMIMGFIDDDYLEWVIQNEISFFVFTLYRLNKVIEVSRKINKPAKIHIELETGLHRTGFTEDQLDGVVALLKKHAKYLEIEGLCSHLAGAESIVNHTRINDQIVTFKDLCNWFKNEGIEPRYRHLACSAGVLNYPESIMDMVRVGTSNYGFWPSSESKMMHMTEKKLTEDPLQRVLSWKSQIMSLNAVPEGKYVSYGQNYLTNRKSVIATVPVGYGYGFSRTLSNNGHVLVDSRRVPVVGNVNMNMVVIDVTDAENVRIGDEVVLIGKQEGTNISVSPFSDMNNSMDYELLTRLPEHIHRRAID